MLAIFYRLQRAYKIKVVQSGCSKPLIIKLACSCILEAGPVTSLTGKKSRENRNTCISQ
jgi:hypothetical protein